MDIIPDELYSLKVEPIVNRSTNILTIDSLKYVAAVKFLTNYFGFTVNNYELPLSIIKYLSLVISNPEKYNLLFSILKAIPINKICQQNQILFLTDYLYYASLRFLIKYTYDQLITKRLKVTSTCFYCNVYFFYKEESCSNTDLRKVIPTGKIQLITKNGSKYRSDCCWDCYEMNNNDLKHHSNG